MGRRIALALAWTALVVVVPARRVSAQGAQAPEATLIDTAPVELDGDVLFHVRGASSFSAESRAAMVVDRIKAVANDPAVPLNVLRLQQGDGVTWVMAGDRPLVGVLDADARLEQLQRDELALAHLTRLKQAIEQYRESRSPAAVTWGIESSLIATAIYVLAVILVLIVARWIRFLLTKWVAHRMEAPRIRWLHIVQGERVAALLKQGTNLLTWVVLFGLTFQYLSYTLERFPGTRPLARGLLGLVIGPVITLARGAVAQLPNLAFLAVLFVVVRIGLRTLRTVFDAVERGALQFGGFEPDWAQPTYKIVRFAVIAFAVVVAYPYLPGSQSEAFKGVSLFVGVVFSLGSSSAVSNIIAGYLLIYRRAFRLGDVVKIGNAIGEVTEFRLQDTRLKSFKDEEVVIPNSHILGSEVTNYSVLAQRDGVILHTEAGIGYETPWRQVEAMLLEAAGRTPGVQKTPAPFVLQKALANFAVTYELNVYCVDPRLMLNVYSDLHRHILDVFNTYGVQIMTPAYMADPPEPKVVRDGQWYTTPARVPADEASRT